MPPKITTYQGFLDLIADNSGRIMMQETGALIERFHFNQRVSPHFSPVTFLLDYTTKKYVYVHDKCYNMLGFKASYFLETGLDEYLGKWHRKDYDILNKHIQPDSINFLKSIPSRKWMEHIFSYNYRILDATGIYKTVLQRATYIPGGSHGLPRGIIGVIFDITQFKDDPDIVHTIETLKDSGNDHCHKVLYRRVYTTNELTKPGSVTKREKEILTSMSDGLSSKEIANKLGISSNTVSNHRKNLLIKTRSRNSSELMNYAVKHGLLYEIG